MTAQQQLVGIVSVPNFFIDRRNPRVQAVPRVNVACRVADIMTTEVRTTALDRPLVELATSFFDLGLPHLTFADPAGKLVSMVTQSDLIVALLAGRESEGATEL